MTIRLVVADDHPLVLRALEDLLASEDDMEVVGVCRDGEHTIDMVNLTSPDVLLLDLSMPGLDGIAVLEHLRSERIPTRVLVFSGNIDDRRTMDCLRLGVAGVILKESPPELLLQAVRMVASGEVWLERRLHSQAVALMLRQEEERRRLAALLTNRETEVFELAARGLRNAEIARELHVTEGTVKIHLHHVFEKLGLSGRAGLIDYARASNLL